MASKRWFIAACFGCLSTGTACSAEETPEGEVIPREFQEAVRVSNVTQSGCLSSGYGSGGETVTVIPLDHSASLQYAAALFRCDQSVVAYEQRPVAFRIEVLVQPEDVNPKRVSDCECRYNISMRLENLDSGEWVIACYRRSDNHTQPNNPLLIDAKTVTIP